MDANADRKRLIGPLTRRGARRIREFQEAVHPCGYRVFAGVTRPPPAAVPLAAVFWAPCGRLGDNRDRDDIDAWADSIAGTLRPPDATRSAGTANSGP